MYYQCLQFYNLPSAAQWNGAPPMEDVVGLFRATQARLALIRQRGYKAATGSAS